MFVLVYLWSIVLAFNFFAALYAIRVSRTWLWTVAHSFFVGFALAKLILLGGAS